MLRLLQMKISWIRSSCLVLFSWLLKMKKARIEHWSTTTIPKCCSLERIYKLQRPLSQPTLFSKTESTLMPRGQSKQGLYGQLSLFSFWWPSLPFSSAVWSQTQQKTCTRLSTVKRLKSNGQPFNWKRRTPQCGRDQPCWSMPIILKHIMMGLRLTIRRYFHASASKQLHILTLI